VTISTYATGNNPTRQNVINYTYDGLNRLTAADYESGTYYHYTYDAVGNRLNETRKPNSTLPEVVNTYDYDNANRLTKVNKTNYSWDANGNLLNDGTNTYTYNSANLLTHLVNAKDDKSYAYNGLGDRISKTSAGQTTNYKLDINAGLTQVLADGTNTFLYGVDRISQENAQGVDYFLGDALGSVRQLVSGTAPDAKVMLTREYSPYGEIVSQSGTGKTEYGFTGELQDGDFVHLRARDYAVADGQFLSRDSWEGDSSRPQSLNKWMYVEGNPITRIDPTGNDAIWLTNNGAAEGFGHTSVLLENGHTNQWYYFYFGPK
jgi:RHS repeat-associated protein